MINNRQGGRRRGRGGQRGQNLGGQPGNRQDNRQRGNAAQLLEKYKTLARDSQLGGDRVQSEYFLQFADHYFRVLNDNRARFEDQRRPRDEELDELEDEDDGLEAESGADSGADGEDRDDSQPEESREPHRDRHDRDRDRNRRFGREQRDERPERTEQVQQTNGAARARSAEERLPMDALPPAIGSPAANAPGDDVEEARPRRRARRPRPDAGEGEIAPAA